MSGHGEPRRYCIKSPTTATAANHRHDQRQDGGDDENIWHSTAVSSFLDPFCCDFSDSSGSSSEQWTQDGEFECGSPIKSSTTQSTPEIFHSAMPRVQGSEISDKGAQNNGNGSSTLDYPRRSQRIRKAPQRFTPPSEGRSRRPRRMSADDGSKEHGQVYDVRAIQGVMKDGQQWRYFVAWDEFPDSENTWERGVNVVNCADNVKSFIDEAEAYVDSLYHN